MPNPPSPRARQTLVLVTVALAALVLGALAASRWFTPPDPALEAGIALPEPRPIAPFKLIDQDGRPYDNARLQGRWSVLFAGFTHCPDVCPTTLAILKQLEAQVPGVAMIFLSVDPQRDTPDALRRYVRHFSPTLTGVTGAGEELDRLCASLGIAYVKVPGATETDYTVDHSAALVLIDPQGRVAGYFQPPHKADTLAADLTRLVESRS